MRGIGLSLFLLLSASRSPTNPDWEKLHSTGAKQSLNAVWAGDDGTWVAAGDGVILRGNGTNVVTTQVPGRFVQGIGSEARGKPLVLGSDDLIASFDGERWVEERYAAGLRKKVPRYHDVLQMSLHPRSAPLIVYGPWRVLVKQEDGSWLAPSEAERSRMSMTAQLGPKSERPPGCNQLRWIWLSDERALFSCHDGRSFLWTSGQSSSLGRAPRSCDQNMGPAVAQGGAIFSLCGSKPGLWKSETGLWEKVPAPDNLQSIASSGRCLYAVDTNAVWRRCSSR